jgi:hypothetical protein
MGPDICKRDSRLSRNSTEKVGFGFVSLYHFKPTIVRNGGIVAAA